MKFDSQKYIRMALENGYKQDILSGYIRGRYSLNILTTIVYLIYNVSDNDREGIATSYESDSTGSIYRYMGVPADILMDIAVGPEEDIRRKLYEYDVNKTLENL